MAKKTAAAKKAATPPARVPVRREKKTAAMAWLEKTNPLVGLSIRTAQNIFDCARQGDTQRLHWLFQEIEAVNPILFTCLERRQAALAAFQWNVTCRPQTDQKLAEEQQDAVQQLIGGIRNFTKTIEHLDTGFFRGFALAQPVWEEDGFVREIILPNSWEFVKKDGVLYHNPECNGFGAGCVDMTDARLIGIERSRAIDYPALSIHIRHAVSNRDWGRFLERYALPKPAVTMAPNATNEQRDDYLAAAQCVENGQVSVWPNGASIVDFAGGSRGTDPFKSFIEHQERTILLLATGGTLTSLAQADTGSLAGGAQMDVWKEIVSRDSAVVTQTFMSGIVRPFLEDKFFGRECAVDFALDMPKKQTPKEAAEVAEIVHRSGYIVNQSELEKAVGFTLERIPEPAPAPGFGMARAKAKEPEVQGARKDLAEVLEKAIEAALVEAVAEGLKEAK